MRRTTASGYNNTLKIWNVYVNGSKENQTPVTRALAERMAEYWENNGAEALIKSAIGGQS